MGRLLSFATLAVLTLASGGMLRAQGTDPYLGTWKLNVAKSKFNGVTPPKSETRTVEAQGSAIKVTFDGVAADGSRISYSLTTNQDGKPVPITRSRIAGGLDMAAVKRIDSHTTTTTEMRAGKAVATTLFDVPLVALVVFGGSLQAYPKILKSQGIVIAESSLVRFPERINVINRSIRYQLMSSFSNFPDALLR